MKVAVYTIAKNEAAQVVTQEAVANAYDVELGNESLPSVVRSRISADRCLQLTASLALEVLRDLKSPGVHWCGD